MNRCLDIVCLVFNNRIKKKKYNEERTKFRSYSENRAAKNQSQQGKSQIDATAENKADKDIKNLIFVQLVFSFF